MSFFGFQTGDLEEEKRRFHEDGNSKSDLRFSDTTPHIAQDEYDGLGDTLLEGGDDLNDETFGGTEPISKDFDYAGHTLSDNAPVGVASVDSTRQEQQGTASGAVTSAPGSSQPSFDPHKSIWDNKSPFSVLPRSGTGTTHRLDTVSRPAQSSHQPKPTSELTTNVRKSASTTRPSSTASPVQYAAMGVRTLQEVEAEMRAQSQQVRARQPRSEQSQSLAHRAESPSYAQLQSTQRHLANIAYQQQHEERSQDHLRLQELERQFRRQALLDEIHEQEQAMIEHEYRAQEQRRLQIAQERQLLLRQQQEQQLLAQSHLLREDHLHSRLYQQQRTSPSNGLSPAQILNLQRQQHMLAQQAQLEFSQHFNNVNGSTTANGDNPEHQDALKEEAMRKIMEHEMMEGKRRRKAFKISHMSRYNDLMTQSDKDFITRIQVSQLVTSDPYTEDYYAQVYVSMLMGLESDERVLKFGSGEGVGLGLGVRGPGRRQNALQRMEAQVERIVNNARQREKEKGLHALHSLQGALGKTAGRSYKAAPRQLLQVETSRGLTSPKPGDAHPHGIQSADHETAPNTGVIHAAGAVDGADNASNGDLTHKPLTRREALVIIEELYDVVLQLDHIRREAQSAPPHDQGRLQDMFAAAQNQLFDGLKVMLPLETSVPHPLVSLLIPAKGKRILPRALRALPHDQALSVLVLLFACFSQLDVVLRAPLLDSTVPSVERKDIELQTDIFLHDVLPGIAEVLVNSKLQLCVGLLTLLLNHCDVVQLAMTWPGLELLRIILHRAKVDSTEVLSGEELVAWRKVWDRLFDSLIAHLPMLFPSARVHPSEVSAGTLDPSVDQQEEPVWRFFATLVLHAEGDQPQYLVQVLREKIIENYTAATKGRDLDEAQRKKKIANINLFLHRLGLDSSQITV